MHDASHAGGGANAPNTLEPHFMPFTWNRRFKQEPKLVAGADGMHYRTPEGGAVLDSMAGLWCVNAGHNRERITTNASRTPSSRRRGRWISPPPSSTATPRPSSLRTG